MPSTEVLWLITTLEKSVGGKFGEASKIREELDEFIDACEQGCKLMALQELSDIRFDSSPEDL